MNVVVKEKGHTLESKYVDAWIDWDSQTIRVTYEGFKMIKTKFHVIPFGNIEYFYYVEPSGDD